MSGIYHSWDGTVLTITSDSGTSSADLKGDDGCRGPQGPAGTVNNEYLNNQIQTDINATLQNYPNNTKTEEMINTKIAEHTEERNPHQLGCVDIGAVAHDEIYSFGFMTYDDMVDAMGTFPVEKSYAYQYEETCRHKVEWVRYLDGTATCSFTIDWKEEEGAVGIEDFIELPFVMKDATITTRMRNDATVGAYIVAAFYPPDENKTEGNEIAVILEHETPASMSGRPITWKGTVAITGYWR